MRLPETPKPEIIYIKRHFLEMMRSGQKTLELRIGFPQFKAIQSGDSRIFSCDSGSLDVEITGVRSYRSLQAIAIAEDVTKIVPGMTKDQFLAQAPQFFDDQKIREYGLVILEMKIHPSTEASM